MRFRRTDGEISKQGWLSIPALAIEVLAYQVGGLRVCWEVDVMGSDLPYFEERIPSVENRSASDLEAVLRRSDGPAHDYHQQKVEHLDSHGVPGMRLPPVTVVGETRIEAAEGVLSAMACFRQSARLCQLECFRDRSRTPTRLRGSVYGVGLLRWSA